jgi:hypothetical protein
VFFFWKDDYLMMLELLTISARLKHIKYLDLLHLPLLFGGHSPVLVRIGVLLLGCGFWCGLHLILSDIETVIIC